MTRISLLFAFALIATSSSALAQKDDWPAARAALASVFDGQHASEWVLRRTPISGLLEASRDLDVLYISTDGTYILEGDIFHVQASVNISEEVRKRARADLMAKIDRASFVTYSADDPKHEVYIFTDPDCGFCRQMHQRMEEYNALGITVHYAAFPRAGAGSNSYRVLTSIWCSDERQSQMDKAKLRQPVEPFDCPNAPVMSQFRLAQALGASGTPTVVLADGSIIPGYIEPERLIARIER
jgi:thiol:disulfide interchange protein DsbC